MFPDGEDPIALGSEIEIELLLEEPGKPMEINFVMEGVDDLAVTLIISETVRLPLVSSSL